MSYCRFGKDSDVYIYPSFNGQFVCCGCKIESTEMGVPFGSNHVSKTYLELLNHMNLHRAKGHSIPNSAFDRVIREMKGEDDEAIEDKSEQ